MAGPNWLQRLITVLAWGYLVGVLAVWGLLALAGDRWWFATVLLFAPRWIYGLPLVALLPVVLLARRWGLLRVLAAALAVVCGPIMGLCLPLGGLFGGGEGPALRVLSLNLDGNTGHAAKLAALLDAEKPDLFAIQECPVELDAAFFAPWHVRRNGGVVVGSRWAISDACMRESQTVTNPWLRPDAVCVKVETPGGPVRFCGVHLATPREGLGTVLSRKIGVAPWRKEELEQGTADRRSESVTLAEWLDQFKEPLIVAGDFNMPDDSGIYRDAWSGYTNAFSARGWGYGYTKWTPLKGSHYGLRIDHILTSGHWQPRRAWVGPDVGSDHLPLLSDVGPK